MLAVEGWPRHREERQRNAFREESFPRMRLMPVRRRLERLPSLLPVAGFRVEGFSCADGACTEKMSQLTIRTRSNSEG